MATEYVLPPPRSCNSKQLHPQTPLLRSNFKSHLLRLSRFPLVLYSLGGKYSVTPFSKYKSHHCKLREWLGIVDPTQRTWDCQNYQRRGWIRRSTWCPKGKQFLEEREELHVNADESIRLVHVCFKPTGYEDLVRSSPNVTVLLYIKSKNVKL